MIRGKGMTTHTVSMAAPINLLGQALLGVLEACRDIRVISRAG
jgi:hypothetical protein